MIALAEPPEPEPFMNLHGHVGFDASRKPFVACRDCGIIPEPVCRSSPFGNARRILGEHNAERHPDRKARGMLPRRDDGLVDWF